MKNIILMIISNIKKKKLQTVLIGITIMLAATLLSAAVGSMAAMQDPFNKMYNSHKGSEKLLLNDDKMMDSQSIKEWWSSQKDVEGVTANRYYAIGGKVAHNNIQETLGDLYLTERVFASDKQDIVDIIEGKKETAPKTGEIWLPTGFAYNKGINIGDTLTVNGNKGNVTFKVSAIILDPQFSPSMINPIRLWVAPEDLDQKFDMTNVKTQIISIKFKDYSKESELWTAFENDMKKPFLGVIFDKAIFEMGYTLFASIFGSIMMLFSIIIVIISMFIIGFTVSNAVLSDYKNIGILKANGYSPRQVMMIYAGQNILISLISVPIGIVASVPLIRAVLSSFLKNLGIGEVNISMLLPVFVTLVSIVTVIAIVAFLAARKVNRIKPADAIRNGSPSARVHASGMPGLFKKFLPVTVILGIRQMLSSKRQALFLLIVSTVTLFVFLFGINLKYSMENMGNNMAYWGFDGSEINIETKGKQSNIEIERIKNLLTSDSSIKYFISYSSLMNTAIPAQNSKGSKSLIGYVYDGDMDKIGAVNLEGRNPQNDNEASISAVVSKLYGKKTGDMIDIFVQGKRMSFLVTGIYQTTNTMGLGYRIQASAARKADPGFVNQNFGIILNDKTGTDQFISKYKAEAGSSFNVKTVAEGANENFGSLISSIGMISAVISLIFALVTFIIIFNVTLININNNKKEFGIMKAAGMTPMQVRGSMALKVLVSGLISIIPGLLLGLILSPKIMAILLSSMGIAVFPFNVNILWTVLAIPAILILLFISVWVPSGRIMKISPRTLISE